MNRRHFIGTLIAAAGVAPKMVARGWRFTEPMPPLEEPRMQATVAGELGGSCSQFWVRLNGEWQRVPFSGLTGAAQ